MSETPTRPLIPDSVPAPAVEQADDRAPMSEEQFLPTCMIWMMFIVLGLFIGAILIWVIANLPMALR